MTLTNIRFFVEAARCENITQAAANLYVSQPALSKHIALMEQEVGVPLFFRANRSVRLTPAGQYLYEQLRDLPLLCDHAFERARAIGKGAAGTFSIGILEGQDLQGAVLDRLNVFSRKYPNLDVRLERNSFSNLRSGLENGHYDLILTLVFELSGIPGAAYEVVIRQNGAIAMSRSNPLAGKEDLTIADLKDENFITIGEQESAGGYTLLCNDCVRFGGFEPKIVRHLSSLESLLLGIEAGMGVAILDRNTRLENHPGVRMVSLPGSYDASLVAVYLPRNGNSLTAEIAKEMSCDRSAAAAPPAGV